MSKTDFDVLIIGGGPAGSVAAINLAKAGLRTALFERKAFPRETLCGEFISSEATNHLKDLILFEKFILLNPNKITSFRLITSNDKIFESDLPFEGYSLKRSVFDQFLLNEAENSGVEIIQPAEVNEIKNEKNNYSLTIKAKNVIYNISGRIVIGAYGKSNILDKKLNRKFSERHSGYSGIKFHINKELLSNFCDNVIYIFPGDDIYCGINAVSNFEVTICFLMKKKSNNKSPGEFLNNLLKDNKIFASFFKDAGDLDITKFKVYGAGNIYFGTKELIPGGIIMIGDAAGMIAPVTGDGIGMAFQSAQIASQIIRDNYINNFKNTGEIYRSEWKKHFIKRIKISRFIQYSIFKNYPGKIPYGIIRKLLPLSINATRN